MRQDDRLCLLVMIGVDDKGNKDILTIEDGYRESCASWEGVIHNLTHLGLTHLPKLAISDGALGF